MKILKLTLTKEWFDLILSGDKKTEYREYKKHWEQRLLHKQGGLRQFDEIHFTNGYGHEKPFIRAEFIGIASGLGCEMTPCNDEPLQDNRSYFEIGIGRILESKNIQSSFNPSR